MHKKRFALSGPDGSFAIASLTAGETWVLKGNSPGFIEGKATVEPLEPFELRAHQEIVLGSGRRVFGQVVNEQDEPVAGAAIRLTEEPGQTDMRTYFGRLTEGGLRPLKTTTDKQGNFSARGLDPAKTYRLEARATGFAPATVPGIALEADGGASDLGLVVLLPGAHVEGIVVDKQQQPLAGAEIMVQPSDPFEAMRRRETAPVPVRSADDGTFRLVDHVPGEELTLMIDLDGYTRTEAANVKPSYNPEPIRIVMTAAARLAGKVLDTDGQPVADASIEAGPANTNRFRSRMGARAVTDTEGLFQLDKVPPGSVALTVSANGFQALTLSDLHLAEGESRDGLELTLTRGGTLTGRVVDTDDKPVAEAFVSLEPTGAGASRMMRSRLGFGRTDGNGHFRIDGLEQGVYEARIHHEEFPDLLRRVEIGPNTQPVRWGSGAWGHGQRKGSGRAKRVPESSVPGSVCE